ncbi:MAG: ribonuclease R [Dissulfurispiraceae bacterium]
MTKEGSLRVLTTGLLTDFFKRKVTRPISFREVALQLSATSSETRQLKKCLREMVRDGVIVRTRKGLYGPPEEMSLVTGSFEAHRDGYGFVILEKPGERDVFIPARATLGVMDNDRVVARMENRDRREGRVIRILERANTQMVGTFEESKEGYYVKPKNQSIPFDLLIHPNEKNKAKDGDCVVAEIVSYPTEKRPPKGRIVRVLRKPENPKEEVEVIIHELNLPGRFPHEVVEEASRVHSFAQSSGPDMQKRKDLRHLVTVTIDGERARDFDDAVSIRKDDGGFILWVHIADVGSYVPWNSPIDKEARKRGTSVYFPDRVIPMLPKELSEDLCSLKPKIDRLVFTVEMAFDSHGERLDSKFYPSLINSDERMTYTSVKKILIDQDPRERKKYGHLINNFELMGELCKALKHSRLLRGSLDFDLPEPEVLLDILGNPEAIISAERNFAHMIIEEFMIAANEAVAEYIEGIGAPSLYRIHEEPDPMKLADMTRVINSLGILKGKRDLRPKDFSGLLNRIRGMPEQDVMHFMILRSLKQARYSIVNVGHFGLASASYTHFTSPIRRYPDLVVHRILREVMRKKHPGEKRIKELESTLSDLAFHSSRMERRADKAENMVISAMRSWFMRDKVGDEFYGKVVSVMPYGLKIRLKDCYVEGFLHVSFMTDDFYQYDEKSISLHGTHKKKRYNIGTSLKVRLHKVDMEQREILFGI